ncbi:hypothetical protein G6F46_010378 [Rhizopus delemar]|nr:hypothetical protein G6F55_009570 [Rhizopus delemar]KAG1541426.1 hypothetical protein G6F51_007899 [Rhizopus arrhizus]KAG1491571.1 hypothetical protein G6F54_009922 [Rhizopus delemar]KAG1509546.1 hypothetical protein G6F53_007360 [Rhizopus delemar]KAG1545042.1 hypothetical protein G6F49_010913 [Rhizopus delemar]
MHGESASVDITSENIQNELRKIEELLGPCDPADIMNFDETGLYYQQPPRRTICSEPLDGLRIPIIIAQDKSHKCFKARANLLSMAAIGKKHEMEYHFPTNAWMTTYVKRLNVAFGRQNRKIALLLDNASIHKIRIPLDNIKSIFPLTNTTSKLQVLDVGIIDKFKAHFGAQQYDRALCLYISKKLDNLNVYKMDQAQKFDNNVTDVSQLNLEADESEMIVCYTTSTTNNEETAEGNIDETEENDNTEQDEQCVDIVEYDLDRKLHCRIRMRLADSCAELNVKRANRSSILFTKIKKHLEQAYLFEKSLVKSYSECDYVVKFWGPLVEKVFKNTSIIPHWGDKIPGSIISLGMKMKMALRLVVTNSSELHDHGYGEVAKECSTSKYSKNKRKIVVASKALLNSIVQQNAINHEKDCVYIPYLIAMGFDMHLSFPSTLENFAKESIEVVNGLLDLVVKGKKRKRIDSCIGNITMNEKQYGISKVIWDNAKEDELEDEASDDEEDEVEDDEEDEVEDGDCGN